MGIKFTVSSHNLEDFACKGTTFFSLLQGCLIFREDYSIRIEKYTGIADNCGIEGEKLSPQMTSNKKKKIGVWFRCGQAGRSQGVDVSRYSKGCRCFMGSPMGANGVRPVGRAETMVALTI